MKVVFDLDGTLADESHRSHLIPDWPKYFALMKFDKPAKSIQDVYWALLYEGHRIEIWTGRPEEYRGITESWLADYGFQYQALYMRPDGVFIPNLELKKIWLEAADPKPDLFIDDNKRIINYMRSQGIVCLSAGDNDY